MKKRCAQKALAYIQDGMVIGGRDQRDCSSCTHFVSGGKQVANP